MYNLQGTSQLHYWATQLTKCKYEFNWLHYHVVTDHTHIINRTSRNTICYQSEVVGKPNVGPAMVQKLGGISTYDLRKGDAHST